MRREKGFGCLVSKGKGKPFLARWVYHGKVYTKSTGEADRRKALKALERLTRPFREEREIDVLRMIEARLKVTDEVAVRKAVPLSELFMKFSALPQSKDLNESTMSIYECMTRQMISFMNSRGRNDISEVTEKDAEEFLEDLANHSGPDAYNIKLVFYKRLWREFGHGQNPFEKFQKRKVSKASSRRALSEDEVVRVMSEAAKNPDDKLLFSLGIYTGLRISDCALLRIEDIDFETNVLNVTPLKTRKHTVSLEIPIHPALRKILKKAIAERTSGYVSEHNAEMYKRGTITDRTQSIFVKSGIKTFTKSEDGHLKLICGFHSLRHTFVSMSINAGMNPLLVQRIVGHSSVNMTSAYFHANKKAIEEGINKIPDFAA